ncbi:uncharacterized protein THITE_2115146 [Thermothielavioides terrestris NRRL 8126]|uniref:Major facilitator superfamily (MFS) profile domain-containing protein n=1 Tax=Thermothielavioides terrestris (strain ATCC 38088 / NRRL 8126) TaxID=578455 RepID=G2R3F7_THETT|nr:uncharacterized protein THITE_2115146 [Thermothielavioides terrestris NRRL 8126]AEO66767.1 hypothetical protein THITE_2115146 [Thermothielavioides terrestris NRRL 8126]
MIILPEITPDHQKKYIAGIVGLVLASAGVLGPVLGGILTNYASWRWVFWIKSVTLAETLFPPCLTHHTDTTASGPIGGFSLLVFLLAWPDKKYLPSLERRSWKDVDFVGAFLLIASVVLIVFPFQNATNTPTTTATSPWATATFLAPLLTGLLSLGLLALWQAALAPRLHKQHNARLALALPPALLRNRVYAAAALHTLLTGFPYLLCVFAFPVRFQVVYGRSALQAGLMLLPMLAGTAVGTVLAGAVNGGRGKVRFLETLLVAAALMLLGCGLETTAEVGDGAVEPRVLGFLVFVGLGFGLSAAGGTMLAGAEAPVWEHASAQGIMAQVRIFGGSIGIAASSAILGTKTRAALAEADVPASALAQLAASDPSGLTPEQWTLVRTVYTDALREDMIVCCAVLAAAMLFTLGVYRRGRVSMQEMLKQRYREEAERRRDAAGAAARKPAEVAASGESA